MAKKTKFTTKSRKSGKHTARKSATKPRSAAASSADAGHIEVIARGVLLDGQRVLLCQNTKHGYLYLPGGHVEFAESAVAAVKREFLEECGVRVRVGRLLMVDEGAFDTRKRRHHEINLVFHVELEGPQGNGKSLKGLKSLEDGIAFIWADLAATPELDVRPLSTKALLASGASLVEGQSTGAEWVSAIVPPA